MMKDYSNLTNAAILHCFDVPVGVIKEHIKDIVAAGYDGIMLSPVQHCKEGMENWKLYQPYDFQVGNRLGVYEEIKDLVREAHIYGLIVIFDVVFRHLAGKDSGEMEFHNKCDYGIVSNPALVMNHNGNAWDYTNREQLINYNCGMPTLNYYNPELWYRSYLPFTDCLLKDIGGDGLRIDQMKHLALPDEGCDLLKIIRERYPEAYIVGEAINLSECDYKLKDKYTKYANLLIDMYDGHWNLNKVMQFVESHDTYHTFHSTTYLSDEERLDKWLLLAKRGSNRLYFTRSNTLNPNEDKTIFSERMADINWSNKTNKE